MSETTARQSLRSLNPATGDLVAEHEIADDAAVRTAVTQARTAAPHWAERSHRARREALLSWKRLIVRRADELIDLIAAETGKPRVDALLEVSLTVEHLHWAARNAASVLGPRRVRPGLLGINQRATVEYQPYGTVGVLGPWNYPLFTPMGSISYALAAGNTVVFKPSEYTPGVGVWLARTFTEATGHTDVLRTVVGTGATGAALVAAGVDKVAFTGSTPTAKRIMAACAETLTPLVVECGGKDAMIVAADADLDEAASAAAFGAMSNAGQTCVGVERVYVVDGVFDAFVQRVRDIAASLEPGIGEKAHYGPITMPSQTEVIRRHIEDALERGATAEVGGADSVDAPYVRPVVLVDVPDDALAATEETFGPTIVITRVSDTEEALRRANESRYGLGASVFSANRASAVRLARRIRGGMVSINSVVTFAAVPALPFGGVGESGFGRIHGADGLREFARAKSITWQRFAPPVNIASFSRTTKAAHSLQRVLRIRHSR